MRSFASRAWRSASAQLLGLDLFVRRVHAHCAALQTKRRINEFVLLSGGVSPFAWLGTGVSLWLSGGTSGLHIGVSVGALVVGRLATHG